MNQIFQVVRAWEQMYKKKLRNSWQTYMMQPKNLFYFKTELHKGRIQTQATQAWRKLFYTLQHGLSKWAVERFSVAVRKNETAGWHQNQVIICILL